MNYTATLLGKARDGHRVLSLSVSSTAGDVLSPYFQRSSLQKVGTDRDIRFISIYMASMCYLKNPFYNNETNTGVNIIYDIESPDFGNGQLLAAITLPASPQQIATQVKQAMVDFALANWSVTITPDEVLAAQGTNPATIPSFTNPTRSLNSAFQISTIRDAQVGYTVDIAATLSLTTGQTGTVTLKYADDSGFTTNVQTVQSSVNGNGGTLAIGLGLTQTATASLNGMIPAGKYVKLVTANTVGSPTFTFRAAQEVLL